MAQQQPATIAFPFPAPPSLYQPSLQLAELARHQPVAQVTFPDGKTAWIVTGYAAVRQVLIDPRFSRAAAAASADAPQPGIAMLANDSILGMDPPEHSRLRRLVARAFTAHRVEQLRPRVAELVNQLIDQMLVQSRPVDLLKHFSLPLPVRVICELLGVPAEDQDTFHAWSDAIMVDWNGSPDQIVGAVDGLRTYFATLIATKRAAPTDDLLTALVSARDDHDRLTEEELITLSFGLLVAGHETTVNQINMSLLTLRQFPDELARLRDNPETIGQAVEELMRFVQLGTDGVGMPRVTTEDVVLSGVTIPAGSAVLPAMGMANRDPAQFTDPDRLDLSRDSTHHLSFGAGAHHCLGAQLARMELQEALTGLLRRLPNLRVAVPDEQLRFQPGMLVRSLKALPVTWDDTAADVTAPNGAADTTTADTTPASATPARGESVVSR